MQWKSFKETQDLTCIRIEDLLPCSACWWAISEYADWDLHFGRLFLLMGTGLLLSRSLHWCGFWNFNLLLFFLFNHDENFLHCAGVLVPATSGSIQRWCMHQKPTCKLALIVYLIWVLSRNNEENHLWSLMYLHSLLVIHNAESLSSSSFRCELPTPMCRNNSYGFPRAQA